MNVTAVPLLLRPYSAEFMQHSRTLLESMKSIFGAEPAAKSLAQMVLQKYPVHARQIRAEATAMDVDPIDLAIGNLCYDLMMGSMGCSTMALATSEGPVLARNMDWFPAEKIAKASCLMDIGPAIVAGFAGMVGVVTGMSKRGFALAVNAVFGGFEPSGYPVLLFLRHILDEADGYESATAMAFNEPLMAGALITIVGVKNDQRVVVERRPGAAKRRMPEGGLLCVTNHYRKMDEPIDCGRYVHLRQFGGTEPAMEVLTHSNVMQQITSQHVILNPARQCAEMFVPTPLLSDNVQENLSRTDVMEILFG